MQYERTPSLEGKFGGGAACRGFGPAPPRFNALVPLPIGSFCEQIANGGCRSIPLDRSRPLSRRSGCFSAWPCPPLSPGSFYRVVSSEWDDTQPRGKWSLSRSPSPQGGTQHAE